jgi:septum formation protein
LNNNIFTSFKLVLGSGSPRRRELLNALNIPFRINVVETDENWPSALPCTEVPVYLALLKARAQNNQLASDELLITADTVVILNKTILNKPIDLNEAAEMLERLSGNTHTVVTGVCLSRHNKYTCFFDATEVTFNTLTQSEIEYYLKNYSPLDKAGAYGIQEWIGCIAMRDIHGNYNNVVGLPTDLLYQKLKTLDNLTWHYY